MARHGNERLKMEDTSQDVVIKLSDGNPGAINVCVNILNYGSIIDPQGLMGMGSFLSMDMYGIYGSRIWMLYKDVCGEHLGKMIGMLRSVQLGFLSDIDLDLMIDRNYTGSKTMDELLIQVQEQLKEFNLEGAVA